MKLFYGINRQGAIYDALHHAVLVLVRKIH